MPDAGRFFFAAWPAPEIQDALGRIAEGLRQECGGRAVPARNIHLTLVFLGDVPRQRAAALYDLAATIEAGAFELKLDRAGYWRHNRIVWAGTSACPPALARLVERILQCLSADGFAIDKRPYVPHVTLLRNARRAPGPGLPCLVDWPVARFALVESAVRDRGRAYEVRREWRLAA